MLLANDLWLLVSQSDAARAGGHCLVLEAPSRFHASYVEAHHKGRLLAARHAVDAMISEIFVVPPEA